MKEIKDQNDLGKSEVDGRCKDRKAWFEVVEKVEKVVEEHTYIAQAQQVEKSEHHN